MYQTYFPVPCEDYSVGLYEDAIRSTDKKALRKTAVLNKLYHALSTEEPHRAKICFRVNTADCLNDMPDIMGAE